MLKPPLTFEVKVVWAADKLVPDVQSDLQRPNGLPAPFKKQICATSVTLSLTWKTRTEIDTLIT